MRGLTSFRPCDGASGVLVPQEGEPFGEFGAASEAPAFHGARGTAEHHGGVLDRPALHVDQHHTTEDSAIAIGQAIDQALGDKAGIGRYGEAHSAMDEALSRVVLDISGRPFLVWRAKFTQERLGEMDTELFREWFQAFAMNAGITLHVENVYGDNNHHIAESAFKALARALRDAVEIDQRAKDRIPSTKGTL